MPSPPPLPVPSPGPPRTPFGRWARRTIAIVASCVLLSFFIRWLVEPWWSRDRTSERLRPGPALLLSIRELARLELIELHLEKVIDLTQKQSRFFGLIETTDAILLVAAGDVTLGVDLSRIKDQDLSFDPESRSARLVLPRPEVFSSRLDEKQTYVYTRTTGLLARRDEQLETRARQAALEAIVTATESTDARERAMRQAERSLRALLTRTGVSQLEVVWR